MKRAALLVAVLVVLAGASQAGSIGNQKVTPAQLALMPLPASELGSAAKGLTLSHDSGVQTNSKAADNANGFVSGAKLARLGRTTGYELDYEDQTMATFDTGHGLMSIQTGVELYRDPAAAASGMAFWRKDSNDETASQAAGVSISNKPFTVSGLGDASFAETNVATLKGWHPISGAGVMFRINGLVAMVSVSGGEDENIRPLAVSLARKLQARLRKVLAGKISGSPVPLPAPLKAGPPRHGPDLSALTLTPKDIGSGTVKKQGYRVDTDLDPISEYERELSSVRSFPYFDETVGLYHSPTEASVKVRMLANMFASAMFGKKQMHFAIYEPKKVQVQGGDEAYAVLARAQEKKTDPVLYEGFVLIRIGSTTEAVTVGALSMSPSSLSRLASLADKRAKAGLQAK